MTAAQSQQDRLTALTTAQAATQAAIATSTAAYTAQAMRTLRPDVYDDNAVTQFANRIFALVRAARTRTTAATQAYLTQTLAELGASPSRAALSTAAQPRGVDAVTEWSRPARQYRYLLSVDTAPEEALQRSVERAEVMVQQDVNMAMRDAARQLFTATEGVTGYRRVLHPELSAHTCGLCIAAADRVYDVADLMPIHQRCECKPMPIVDGNDPARFINELDLSRLYDDAGGTTAGEALKKTRYVVHEHGELGPVLRRAGDHFRDASDIVSTL